MKARNTMAASATLHCLTGCAIGEVAGLMIGTAAGLSTGVTIALAVALAFLFGYALSTLPLISAGLGFFAALSVVFAADTLSILTMEITDNVVMAVIPGAMDAGLVNPVFWIGMMIALTAAFIAAFPVNRYLIDKGKGHALTHEYAHAGAHGEAHGEGHDEGHGEAHGSTHDEGYQRQRKVPVPSTAALAAAVIGFLLGGFVVSVADELADDEPAPPSHGAGLTTR
ncbi:MAG: DUF4396 domain-containing protein [Actinomycetota bacterium]|nr:DUF4396 domain-containing protein [Actinomycetota bacterium]